ncbi:hypothetical protein AV530_006371 [Patagioenas fasciata monilis]|uniref:Uncharacterized protein n=1 Tax=Patagioenas fasciata monilis TaxID=372326 RepID=A0A1V4KG83_PATFA|nr:hypothetical protein AV530_006371 [Patagioenas fasciata monilis]
MPGQMRLLPIKQENPKLVLQIVFQIGQWIGPELCKNTEKGKKNMSSNSKNSEQEIGREEYRFSLAHFHMYLAQIPSLLVPEVSLPLAPPISSQQWLIQSMFCLLHTCFMEVQILLHW